MYDYATQNKQNQIITLLGTTNSKLDDLNSAITYGSYAIFFVVVFCFVFFLCRSFLGGNRYD